MAAIDKNYVPVLDESIMWMMKNAVRISLSKPDRLVFFFEVFLDRKKDG